MAEKGAPRGHRDFHLKGDLKVDGTTTTINSTVIDLIDPIITIGQNSSDDSKDRGIAFKYNDGSAKIRLFHE